MARAAADLTVTQNDGFCCAVTGFAGFEQEILRLRNANRDHPETMDYLRWRYQSSPDAPPPQVFWLLSPQGERIGMGSAVFRPYWIRGARLHAAVLGDISLDTRWRGRGLGERLIRFITAYLDEHFPGHPGFVIPTEAARRALLHAGWTTAEDLVPYVHVLDGSRYARELLRSEWLASRIAVLLRAPARALARLHTAPDATLRLTDVLDAALQELIRGLPAPKDAVRELSPESLGWRYTQHPHTRFSFAAFSRAGQLRGLLVYEDATLEQTCSIYDFLASSPADLRAMLALFIRRCLDTPGITSLRILVNARHPDRSYLRRLGFIPRRSDTVFQIHSKDGTAEALSWCATQGDKDT